MTLMANAEGKLHVCRQVEDYMFRPVEFEAKNFLDYTVETYERRATKKENDNEDDVDLTRTKSVSGRYMTPHPKSTTHIRVHRFENHVYLRNIVGPWLPCRDGDEDSKPFYYAAMLALLKPWRNLEGLKESHERWEDVFTTFMTNANQRDRDVIAGGQYYYESKNILRNRESEEDREDLDEHNDEIDGERGDDEDAEDDVAGSFVRNFHHLLLLLFVDGFIFTNDIGTCYR